VFEFGKGIRSRFLLVFRVGVARGVKNEVVVLTKVVYVLVVGNVRVRR